MVMGRCYRASGNPVFNKPVDESRSEKRKEVKDKLKSGHIDFENTINSAFNSKPLYDKLKVLCHPDRFANTPLEREANAIFQEIQANRYNYSKLMDLKDQAIKTLHINFNDNRIWKI